ncbi:Protein of uncharacterised function (DUF3800) [Streptococcus criceti]|uniref:DUF3800 domain-containing protein n=1 Tax=Streptococcus criceti HS-6 TaxID=873449 RepID=G5JNG4_STRCG|nr:DUF3800 domain-containing protein [Streptococcus criceti]EHI73847.1 hypothetical protein STRCR_1419 [Streptococcus criceti HS-6]SUN43339.1 Protein of uncharacterised function (DUF3800) [Streptococcus criceti]
MKISLFIDDSGVFHSNNDIFVYAGDCFVSDYEKMSAKHKYKKINKEISKSLNRSDELKASNLKRKHKRALYKVLEKEISFSVVIDIQKIKEYVIKDKKSRQRFKDYALKRIVKELFKVLIDRGIICKTDDINLFVNIDQQGFSTNGFYGLGDGIFEELHEGITNFNYGNFFPPILTGNLDVITKSCVSENDYLIQAADILANRIWNSYRLEKSEMRNIPNHVQLDLP